MNSNQILEQLCERHPSLIPLKNSIAEAAEMIIKCYSERGKILVCGNGGSSSDSDHMVGELMKSFEKKIPVRAGFAEKLSAVSEERGKYLAEKLENGFAAISLSSQTSLTTAICNDIGADLVFAQQVSGYACDGDVLVAISTSGNSQNITDACITAKALNMWVIGLTGMRWGKNETIL